MGRCARRTRRSIAGIVATVIMFAILFTVGTSYFVFLNNENQQYVSSLVAATNKLQGSVSESLTVTTILIQNDGSIGFYFNDTSGLNANVTTALLLSSSGQILSCVGKGLSTSTCSQQSATFTVCTNSTCSTVQSPAPSSLEVNAGRGSSKVDMGYTPVSGATYTVKLLTARGNAFTQTYPDQSNQQANTAITSGAIEVNMNSFKWVHLLPVTSTIVQSAYSSNCNSSLCGKQYTSPVTAGNTLVYTLGWYGQSAPNTPTDTLGSSWTLQSSVTSTGSINTGTVVQTKFNKNCNSAACSQAYTSSVTSQNTLVYALGWANQNPPSTPTDTLTDSFSLLASNSQSATGTPTFVQDAYTPDCNAANCAQAFNNNVVLGDTLVYGLGWYGQSAPSTPTDTLGDTYALGVSQTENVANAPTISNQANPTACSSSSTCAVNFGPGTVAVGDVIAFTLGWSNHAAPSSVSDSRTASFSVGSSQSVTIGANTYYSYIYYGTATSSGTDTITANFGSSATSMASAYDINGVTTSGLQTSTGASSSSSGTASVTSFTPSNNALVIGAVMAGASTQYSSGVGYGIPGGPAPCNAVSPYACSEQATSGGAATTVPMGLNPSVGYTEAAIAFPSTGTNYYSYIWYATAKSAGADTVTAGFSQTVQASESVYEVSSGSTSGLITSTGGSTSNTGTASVSSMTPNSNSFVIGNVETNQNNENIGQGGGYTIIQGGHAGCGGGAGANDNGCSEYQAGLGSATTVGFNLNPNAAWVESAISFSPATNTYYSYIWAATAKSSGADTITASFSSPAAGSESLYELNGFSASGAQSSTGGSTSSNTASVTSFNPAVNSIVIGDAEDNYATTNWGQGGGYTIIQGGGGGCGSALGCSEYETGWQGSATTTSMNIGGGAGSPPWVETAVALPAANTNFYTYIWTAIAASSGTDTVSAQFSSSVAGTVSIYELEGWSPTGLQSSTGSSSAGSTSTTVTGFVPAVGSIIIGAVETGAATNNIQAGTGYSLVSNSCNSAYGCSEYNSNANGGTTTTPFTLGTAASWVEAAVSLPAPINPQSGIQVGGYPTLGIPAGASIAFEATFTNTDPQERTVALWPQSVITVASVETTGNAEQSNFFIVDGLNAQATTIVAYGSTSTQFLTLPYNVPTVLYFGAAEPEGNVTSAIDNNVDGPFYAFFSLSGLFSNNQLYGQTIPFPYGIITGANAYSTPTAGRPGSTATLSCSSQGPNGCGFNACPSQGQPGPGGPGDCQKDSSSQNAFVAWINSAGTVTTLTTFRTTSGGGLPNNLQFTVPNNAPLGYYTVMVSDYENTVFMTFQVT